VLFYKSAYSETGANEASHKKPVNYYQDATKKRGLFYITHMKSKTKKGGIR